MSQPVGEAPRQAPKHQGVLSTWLPYAHLAGAAGAGALWYVRPELGPWPLVLVVAPMAARWVVVGRPTRRTPLDLPLALFLATACMGVWAAFDRETAWAKWWILVGGVGIYYAVANLPTEGQRRTFAWLYALLGAAIAIYYLWTNNWIHGAAKIEALTELGKRIQALFPPIAAHQMQPNVVGGMLAMIVPFQITALITAQGRWRQAQRALVTAALALTLFSLVLTTSRGAWLALGTGLGLWGMWKASGVKVRALPQRHKDTKNEGEGGFGRDDVGVSRGQRWLRFLTMVAVVIAVIGAALLLFPGGAERALALVPGENQLPSRVALWQRALGLIRDTPYTGGGLGSFPALDSAYVYPIIDWIRYPVHIWVVNIHSHNLWLDVAVEQGLPGLLALLWLQGTFVVTVWRAGRARDEEVAGGSEAGVLIEAAVVSALVVAIHALVDDVPYGSRAMLLFLVPAGVVVAAATRTTDKIRAGGKRMRTALAGITPVVIALVGLGALVWRQPLAAAWQANLGAVEQARAELAGYMTEGFDLYSARATADVATAVAHLNSALAIDPEQPTATLRLGLIRLGQGDYETAIPLLERAVQAQPRRQAARQGLAEAYLASGRLEESATLWAGVDDVEAKLRQLSRWYQHSGDETRAIDAAQVATMVAHE